MSKSKDLIINVAPNEITIALLEDQKLVELNKEKSESGFLVGDIYLGKVRKLMPGLNAAFVDIGHEKDAFIHYLDLGQQFATISRLTKALMENKKVPKFENLRMESLVPKNGKIGSYLTAGDAIIAQIAKEAISTKGPRLTSDISLAGRNVVLIPFSSKVNISKKIRSNGEKKRLTKIVSAALPKNYGAIVRTVAMDKGDQELSDEIKGMIEKWEKSLYELRRKSAPALIQGEMSRANTIIRDLLNGSFNSIHVDDPRMYEEIRDYIRDIAPDKENILKNYKGREHILEKFDINRQIQGSFSKFVSLKRGSYLIIEHTEALHSIDVNSGNRAKVGDDQERTALNVNMLAAEEIARQLRLRDMGGIIVIDFIDMHRHDNRQALHNYMKDMMAEDRAKHTILPITKFGLMQITRQRVRPEVITNITEQCPTCGGSGEITPVVQLDQQIEGKLSYLIPKLEGGVIKIVVNPIVGAYLSRGFSSIRKKWATKYRCKIKIVEDFSMGIIDVKFLDKNDKELK